MKMTHQERYLIVDALMHRAQDLTNSYGPDVQMPGAIANRAKAEQLRKIAKQVVSSTIIYDEEVSNDDGLHMFMYAGDNGRYVASTAPNPNDYVFGPLFNLINGLVNSIKRLFGKKEG